MTTKYFLFALLATPIFAADAPAPEAPSWAYSATPAYVSTFMYRGQRVSGQAAEATLDASYGSFDTGLWANVPFQTIASQPEVDLYSSYNFALNDSLAIQPGFLLYLYSHAPSDQGYYQATFEPSLSLVYTVKGVTLKPVLYYDVVLRGPTYELNGSYAIKLDALKTELDLTGAAGTYLLADYARDGVRGWGNYWLAGVAAPFSLTEKSKLTVGWAYTRGTGSTKQGALATITNPACVGRGVATVTYAYSF